MVDITMSNRTSIPRQTLRKIRKAFLKSKKRGAPLTYSDLSKMFGVGSSTVSKAIHGGRRLRDLQHLGQKKWRVTGPDRIEDGEGGRVVFILGCPKAFLRARRKHLKSKDKHQYEPI